MSSEGRPSSSHAGIIAMFIPKPSLKHVMFWQGIVEIVARAIIVVR